MSIITAPAVRCKPFKANLGNPFIYEIKIMGSWVQTNRAFVDWVLEFGHQRLGVNQVRESID